MSLPAEFPQIILCPACGSILADAHCGECATVFSETLGILDLRWPRPRPTKDERSQREEHIVEQLIDQFDRSSLAELVDLVFQVIGIPEGVSESILDTYQAYRKQVEERGGLMVEMFLDRLGNFYNPPGKCLALDVGCGVGAAAFNLTSRFKWVVGFDPTLSNLILAKKYCEEKSIDNLILLQATAQRVPLESNCADLAIAQNVIEHLFDVETAFKEVNRVLQPNGCFVGDSRNRFDIFFHEPHVRLRWFGFVPRKWQSRYAQWRRSLPYASAYLLSLRELRHYSRLAFGNLAVVTFPSVSTYGSSSRWDRWLRLIERIPLLRTAFLTIFPSHLLVARSDKADSHSAGIMKSTETESVLPLRHK